MIRTLPLPYLRIKSTFLPPHHTMTRQTATLLLLLRMNKPITPFHPLLRMLMTMQIPLPLPWIEKRLSFNDIHAQLLACVSFRQLKMTANRLAHIADQFALPTNRCHIGEQPVEMDDVARCLMPEDAPERHFPVCVLADGNCFPRALSLLLFGSEDHHVEL